MNPKLTSEQVEEMLKSNNLVIIDFFCLPDELQNIELSDKDLSEQEFFDALARSLADTHGSDPSDPSRW